MRLRDTVLGALGLLAASPGSLDPAEVLLAQGLADVASFALVHSRAAADQQAINEQLQLSP